MSSRIDWHGLDRGPFAIFVAPNEKLLDGEMKRPVWFQYNQFIFTSNFLIFLHKNSNYNYDWNIPIIIIGSMAGPFDYPAESRRVQAQPTCYLCSCRREAVSRPRHNHCRYGVHCWMAGTARRWPWPQYLDELNHRSGIWTHPFELVLSSPNRHQKFQVHFPILWNHDKLNTSTVETIVLISKANVLVNRSRLSKYPMNFSSTFYTTPWTVILDGCI